MVDKHPSFGMIEVAKFNCNNNQFFGSDLTHLGGISIAISLGDKERNLSKDWYHGDKPLIKIEMSANQFVDAITNGMNTSGVPCTIKYFNGKNIKQVEHVTDKKEVFLIEMENTQKEFIKQINDISEKLNNRSIGKKFREDIQHDLGILSNHIESNTEFVMKSFAEQMVKLVTAAKHSISNYIDNKIHTYGLKGLKKKLKTIESKL